LSNVEHQVIHHDNNEYQNIAGEEKPNHKLVRNLHENYFGDLFKLWLHLTVDFCEAVLGKNYGSPHCEGERKDLNYKSFCQDVDLKEVLVHLKNLN